MIELEAAREIRPLASIEELARRVSSLTRADLTMLAEVGVLNSIGEGISPEGRALAGRTGRPKARAQLATLDRDEEVVSPLRPMKLKREWWLTTLRQA